MVQSNSHGSSPNHVMIQVDNPLAFPQDNDVGESRGSTPHTVVAVPVDGDIDSVFAGSLISHPGTIMADVGDDANHLIPQQYQPQAQPQAQTQAQTQANNQSFCYNSGYWIAVSSLFFTAAVIGIVVAVVSRGNAEEHGNYTGAPPLKNDPSGRRTNWQDAVVTNAGNNVRFI